LWGGQFIVDAGKLLESIRSREDYKSGKAFSAKVHVSWMLVW